MALAQIEATYIHMNFLTIKSVYALTPGTNAKPRLMVVELGTQLPNVVYIICMSALSCMAIIHTVYSTLSDALGKELIVLISGSLLECMRYYPGWKNPIIE